MFAIPLKLQISGKLCVFMTTHILLAVEIRWFLQCFDFCSFPCCVIKHVCCDTCTLQSREDAGSYSLCDLLKSTNIRCITVLLFLVW